MNTVSHQRPISSLAASADRRKDRPQLSDLISVVYGAGATRQADLVKLVAGYATPVEG
jgi:hypothetical protein